MSFREEKELELLKNLNAHHAELVELLASVSGRRYESGVYRYYSISFKVYGLQEDTRRMVDALRRIAPEGTTLTSVFEEICQAGASGKPFEPKHNADWTTHTRPFVEAFFHARYFMEMAVKYGQELDTPPMCLPFGWAALLCLYQIR
ncbi:MAG TPA: hypothetical protein VI457_02100 [Methylococcaceae bacterium]|nr:hypothetical protein [Methylococcaceae bacterium]